MRLYSHDWLGLESCSKKMYNAYISDTTFKPQSKSLFGRLAENFIDLRGLPLTIKLLTIGGYLSVFFLLIIVLLFEVIGDNLPAVQFSYANNPRIINLPLVVMAFTILFFILGWVYILTGAGMAKARIFLPVLALFLFQLLVITPGQVIFPLILEILFFICLTIIYAVTFQTRFWRDYPLVHFGGWLGSILFFIILAVGTSNSNSQIATNLSTSIYILTLITLLFWIFLGMDAVSAGIKIGRWFTTLARRFLPYPALSALAVFVLIIHPILTLLFLLELTAGWGLVPDLVLSIAFVLAAIVVWIMRRWNESTAAIFLSLSLAFPVISMASSMAGTDNSDWVESLLRLTGIFPPLFLFVGLTIYNLLSTGVAFTSVDGRIIPRGARVLLYFGVVILVTTLMLLVTNERFVGTRELAFDLQIYINGFFVFGSFFLGIPYFIWQVWKRREVAIGDDQESTSPPRWSWLQRVPAWVLLALSLSTACLTSCALGLVIYWLL